MERDLVYDVGVNDGVDSAYYLAMGYRVVGIEADPLLAQALRARFSDEIADGAFTLLNVGVAETEGEAEFWVSERTLWSSFDKAMASRDGLSVRAVPVKTLPLAKILQRHGVPFYCKVDVEGYDGVCVKSLDRGLAPAYLSMELNVLQGDEDLFRLKELGYTRFKIISQVTRSQPSPTLMSLACMAPYRVGALLRLADRRLRGVPALHGWSFGEHSSGPFAEETPGAWRDHASILALWRFLKNVEGRREAKGHHEWFDIHAALDPAAIGVTAPADAFGGEIVQAA